MGLPCLNAIVDRDACGVHRQEQESHRSKRVTGARESQDYGGRLVGPQRRVCGKTTGGEGVKAHQLQ